jgi:glycosyl transferase family 25
MQRIPVFIISLKNSKRINILKKRFKEVNIKFKIIYGINGKLFLKKKKLHLIYEKNQTIKNIERELSAPEIGAAASHLKVYAHLIKKKIKQAIIAEDDVYPSKLLFEYINNNFKVKNNEIISFYSSPSSSFLHKKAYKKILNKKVGIYNFATHAFNCSCYQINIQTCKKIINLTNNKVAGLPDWPFLTSRNKIKLLTTLPFLTLTNDYGFSYLEKDRKKLLKSSNIIKKLFSEKLISYLRIPYYLSYIPYWIKYKNPEYYYEHYSKKYLIKLKNIFSHSYIDINKIHFDENYYAEDLKKFIKKFKF